MLELAKQRGLRKPNFYYKKIEFYILLPQYADDTHIS